MLFYFFPVCVPLIDWIVTTWKPFFFFFFLLGEKKKTHKPLFSFITKTKQKKNNFDHFNDSMSHKEKRHSEEIARRHRQVHSTSFNKIEILSQAPIVEQKHFFYKPTPPPETVVIHSKPKKSKDACCWGCAAALCLCFGIKECCSS